LNILKLAWLLLPSWKAIGMRARAVAIPKTIENYLRQQHLDYSVLTHLPTDTLPDRPRRRPAGRKRLDHGGPAIRSFT
jgi:hypothetical protein